MSSVTIVERTAELIQTDIDGDLVALDVEQGNCFGFNATASRVWELVAQPRALDEVVDTLTAEYDIDRAECAAAVAGLVDDMVARKLVKTYEASAAPR